MNASKDTRWIQRFSNYKRAMTLLREMVQGEVDLLALEPIAKEGTIQRFEYTFELAWKTLKDKMEHDGLVFERVSPKYVLKLAYQTKYITNIEIWLEMSNDRNLLSHTYNFATFDAILSKIESDYFAALDSLYTQLLEEQR